MSAGVFGNLNVNPYSSGRNEQLVVNDPALGIVRMGGLTEFNSRPEYVNVKVRLINGVVRYLSFPEGWTGTFEIERDSGAIDAYFAQLESNFFAGALVQNAQIQQTIQEADGSTSTYVYKGVVLEYEEAGAWKGEDTVKQRIKWYASTRIKV